MRPPVASNPRAVAQDIAASRIRNASSMAKGEEMADALEVRVAALEAAPSGGVLAGDAVVTIPGPGGALYWEETVAAVDVTPTSRIFVTLAPALDADENCPELLDLGSLAGRAGTDEITIMATFAQAATGPIKLHWSAV